MTPETKVKAKIRAYLDSLAPDTSFQFPYVNTGRGIAGIGDRIWCYRGRFVMLEVKSEAAARVAPSQRARIADVVRAGGIAEVVWGVEHVMAIKERIDDELRA